MQAGRKWRRMAIERNGRLVPLPDNWSLLDAETGFPVAQIYAERGGWRYITRSIRDNELIDAISGWKESGEDAKEYCKAQTSGLNYRIQRKRTKEEILRHAGVRR